MLHLSPLATRWGKKAAYLVSEETIAGHVHADKSTVVRSVKHLIGLGLLAVTTLPAERLAPARR